MSDVPSAENLTRQPGAMGRVATEGDVDNNGQVTPEEALAEARAARERAEAQAARDRASAETAQRERDEARARATAADAGAFTVQEQAIETAISAQKSAVEQARAAIANAHAAGDSAAVADASDKLAEARAALIDLGNRKQWFAEQKTRQAQRPEQSQPQQNGARVSTPGGDLVVAPAAKQWMDAHPRFYNDASYYNHAVAAHSTITADGIQEGTPAYFRELDNHMQRFERFEAFERGGEQEGRSMNGNNDPYAQQRVTQQPSAPAKRPSASSYGAPVSRSTPASNNYGNGPIDPMAIARTVGQGVTVDDLRSFARDNGFTKQRGYESDEAGFQAYLKDLAEIDRLNKNGERTGLVIDQVYR